MPKIQVQGGQLIIYNSSAPTFEEGQSGGLQGDINGNLKITLATGLNSTDDSVNIKDTGTPTESAVAVGTSSTDVLAANAARKHLTLINDSDAAIYVSVDGGAAAANTGIKLAASGTTGDRITFDRYIPTGTVKAISSGANKNLLVIEG